MHESYKVCKNCFNIIGKEDGCCNIKTAIDIDKNIYPIIKDLNEKGYETTYCCEGGYEYTSLDGFPTEVYSCPYISFGEEMLKDKNLMKTLAKYLLNLPFPWYIDAEDILVKGTIVIRRHNPTDKETEDEKNENLHILQQYIEEIPPRRLLKNIGMLENYIEQLFEEEYMFGKDNSQTMTSIQESINSLQEKIDSKEWKHSDKKFWK